MLKGIDISKFQGKPTFTSFPSDLDFVILKATEGVGYTDSEFSRNKFEARKANLLIGYYHFARPDLGNTPEMEANYFLQVIGDLQPGEVLVLDYEVSYSQPVQWCKKFLDIVFERTGCKPLIYLNQSQIQSVDWGLVALNDYGLWVASYDGKPDGLKFDPKPWGSAAFKQFTSEGAVNGIVGKVDLDSFFGDKNAFKSYGIKATPPTPSNPPDNYRQTGIDLFDAYRNERKTGAGAEGNYEAYARAVIDSDREFPILKAMIVVEQNARKATETELQIKTNAFESLKEQLKIAQDKIKELVTTPPNVVYEPKFTDPVAKFLYKLAKLADK